MSEFRRLETSPADTVDRDSRTDALLVEGLDQYFQGRYEEAIHLWTRVLFLDRAHARARAYINRARTALGERQRRADEMLHLAGDLLSRGELDQARKLLTEAEHNSGADEKVAELWARLERVERTRTGRAASPPPAAIVDAVPIRTWRWSLRSVARIVATAAFGALLVTAAASPAVRGWITGRHAGGPIVPALPAAPLPVLSESDVALVRARALYARGRLAEALNVLDRADIGGTNREAADALRVEIQQWLLTPRRSAAAAAQVE